MNMKQDILSELNHVFNSRPGKYFPNSKEGEMHDHFFPDLEDGYMYVAGSKIHLYALDRLWSVVFEINGYHTRQGESIASLFYFGNCLNLEVFEAAGRKYISNLYQHTLISGDEFERIELQVDDDEEAFERIDPKTEVIQVNGQKVPFEPNRAKYVELGIQPDAHNPSGWIEFGEFMRYLHETDPAVLAVSDSIIERPFATPLSKLMTIDKFHFHSVLDKTNCPSELETFQQIANVLESGDKGAWSPTLKANNDWRNWESGIL